MRFTLLPIGLLCFTLCQVYSLPDKRVNKETSYLRGHDSWVLSPPIDRRPELIDRKFSSIAVEKFITEVSQKIRDPVLRDMFQKCYPSTLDTTVEEFYLAGDDGLPETFLITGDIRAMWIRDSTNQVFPYLSLARSDPLLSDLILGVLHRQAKYLSLDPYANAFKQPDAVSDNKDDTVSPKPSEYVWEAKYELDSIAAFFKLAVDYYRATNDTRIFKSSVWTDAVVKTLAVVESQKIGSIPEYRNGDAGYRFLRMTNIPTDTVVLGGRGPMAKECGLIRSTFRPSDDATTFPYLVPANYMFAAQARLLSEVLVEIKLPSLLSLAQRLSRLSSATFEALQKHGTAIHPHFGKILAYEVDCFGSALLMDDANVPSLLALPTFVPFSMLDSNLYHRTRKYVLSEWNPFFFSGKDFSGVGSPHTGLGNAWHIALSMQILTSTSDEEISSVLSMIRNSTAGTGFMHESFDVENPESYTRSWFAWANSVFASAIIKVASERPYLL